MMMRVPVIVGLLAAAAGGLTSAAMAEPPRGTQIGQVFFPEVRISPEAWTTFIDAGPGLIGGQWAPVPGMGFAGPVPPAPAMPAGPAPAAGPRYAAPGSLPFYSNPAARYRVRPDAGESERDAASANERGPVQEVVVVGQAAIRDGDTVTARRAAIQDALRQGLEKVVGVYVSSDTLAEKFLTLNDRVYTHSEGFAVPTDILEEKAEEGTLSVRMRVAVGLRPLVNRLKELGLTRSWKVAVVVQEGEGATGAATIARQELTQRLIKAGFQVVDMPAGDGNTINALLERLHDERGTPLADFLVIGSAQARLAARMPVRVRDRVVATVPVYNGRVDARAIRVETGELAASRLADETVSDDVEGIAAGTAVQVSARRVASAFVDDIALLPAASVRRVVVEAHGFTTRARAQAFEDALPELLGVRRVQRQGYVSGRVQLDVDVDSGVASRLGTELESAAPMKGFGVTVESDTKARITLRVSQ
ncbi:MAG: hypothetical protein HY321_19935 [Armatimonadetes bacterium]|nr:hypothetical protein [Armatimonadota bacterium]